MSSNEGVNASLSFSEQPGELCARPAVQGSKQRGKEQAGSDPLSGKGVRLSVKTRTTVVSQHTTAMDDQ